jgi:hypothetical protein
MVNLVHQNQEQKTKPNNHYFFYEKNLAHWCSNPVRQKKKKGWQNMGRKKKFGAPHLEEARASI